MLNILHKIRIYRRVSRRELNTYFFDISLKIPNDLNHNKRGKNWIHTKDTIITMF